MDIEVTDGALSGWVGEPWSHLLPNLERDKNSGAILTEQRV